MKRSVEVLFPWFTDVENYYSCDPRTMEYSITLVKSVPFVSRLCGCDKCKSFEEISYSNLWIFGAACYFVGCCLHNYTTELSFDVLVSLIDGCTCFELQKALNSVLLRVVSFKYIENPVTKENTIKKIKRDNGAKISMSEVHVTKKYPSDIGTWFGHHQNYIREITAIDKLRGCDGIVKVFGLVDRGFVMEKAYCDADDIRIVNFPFETKEKLCSDIVDTVRYIHSHGVAHRDIKTENILIFRTSENGDYKAKLCDFGIARFAGDCEGDMYTGEVCSMQYRPPELVKCGAMYAKYNPVKVDLWSLGCVIFKILSGTSFVREYYDNYDRYSSIISSRYNGLELIIPPNMEKSALCGVMRGCLNIYPNLRTI